MIAVVLSVATEGAGRDLLLSGLSLLAGIGIGALIGARWAVKHPRGIVRRAHHN